MIETILYLTLAHLLADFIFQTDQMAENKHRLKYLALHILIVGVASFIAIGGDLYIALFIAATHLYIDAAKVHILPKNWQSYIVDQSVHIAMIILGAHMWPTAFENGWWANFEGSLNINITILTICTMIIATSMGGHFIGMLMKAFPTISKRESLRGAGKMIGYFERILIIIFMTIGEPASIGFLIAAKSILRFESATKDRATAEYVIIGTLASFTWAILIGFAANEALEFLRQAT